MKILQILLFTLARVTSTAQVLSCLPHKLNYMEIISNYHINHLRDFSIKKLSWHVKNNHGRCMSTSGSLTLSPSLSLLGSFSHDFHSHFVRWKTVFPHDFQSCVRRHASKLEKSKNNEKNHNFRWNSVFGFENVKEIYDV